MSTSLSQMLAKTTRPTKVMPSAGSRASGSSLSAIRSVLASAVAWPSAMPSPSAAAVMIFFMSLPQSPAPRRRLPSRAARVYSKPRLCISGGRRMGDRSAILVTGAAGLLGRSVVERLAQAGRPYLALDRVPPADADFPIELADLRDVARLFALL